MEQDNSKLCYFEKEELVKPLDKIQKFACVFVKYHTWYNIVKNRNY